MTSGSRKRVGTRTFAWIGVGCVCTWIAFAPLFQNTWARWTWQQVPCDLKATGRFIYGVNNAQYSSDRGNFWASTRHADRVSANVAGDGQEVAGVNDTCWVAPNDPTGAVLRLDAWQHLDQGTSRYSAAGLLLVVTTCLLILGPRQRRRSQSTRA